MNHRFVIGQLGLLLGVLALAMLAVTGFSALLWARGNHDEKLAMLSMLVSAALGAALGGACWLYGRQKPLDFLGRREALLLVAVSWLLGAALAALPFFMWAKLEGPILRDHPWHTFAGAYFEAMSGLTTTGSTVLDDIGRVPRGLLLWRALTHWLGGLGIVVLFVAVLPTLGVGGKRLFQAEVPGPQQRGLRPRIGETARILWLIYVGLTFAAVLALRLTGQMDWFESICHSFSMVSTGGLSTRDASIGAFDSLAVDLITMVFMTLAGVNFVLFYHLTRGRWRVAWRDTELRVYLTLKVCVALVVILQLIGSPIVTTTGQVLAGTVGQALRYGGFQTVALHTGTGFVTADYDAWPFLSRTLLVGLMFIGGSAGSTAGGIKVIRFWIALKVIVSSVEQAFRPRVVRPLKVGGSAVDTEMKLAVLNYVLIFLLLVALGTVAICLCEPANSRIDFVTAVTASLSSLSNVGPGLHEIGATKNYGWFSAPSLWVMSLLMVLGRLEVYALFVLLLPSFWRQD